MKRFAIAVAVTLASACAHAESWFQFEAGAGFVHQQHAGDGLWYWQGATHSMRTNNAGVRAGLQLNLTQPDGFVPGLRMHATYYNFGTTNWSAYAGEDGNAAKTRGYDSAKHQCYNNECGQFRRFDSTGGMQAIALTLEPFWDIGGGWRVGVEFGPALFRSTWNVNATALPCADEVYKPGSVETFTRTPRWQFGQLAGVSIGKGAFTVRYNYLRAPVDMRMSGSTTMMGGNQWVPSGVSAEHMISINYTF